MLFEIIGVPALRLPVQTLILDGQWREFLDRLPDITGNAYEAIVANAYLSAYQSTLQVILGVIAVMILVSFGFAAKKRTSEERKE